MADKPILFSGPMVRAILDGRKTQTRRVLKLGRRRPDYIGPRGCTDDPSCWGWGMDDGDFWLVRRGEGDEGRLEWPDWRGAYRVGDRLWVRETCATWKGRYRDVVYRASETEADWADLRSDAGLGFWKVRPSIHMPRWASRLTLIVTDVRVQRVQDISTGDAMAEGMTFPDGMVFGDDPKDAFRSLWDSLNAARAPWSSNPWVCSVTFEAHKLNIDQMEARRCPALA